MNARVANRLDYSEAIIFKLGGSILLFLPLLFTYPKLKIVASYVGAVLILSLFKRLRFIVAISNGVAFLFIFTEFFKSSFHAFSKSDAIFHYLYCGVIGIIAFTILSVFAWLSFGGLLSQGEEENDYSEEAQTEGEEESTEEACSASKLDPYVVLKVERDATREEIRASYLAKMHQYHPDKVSHLGSELQKVANLKTIEIQAAYDWLYKNNN